MSSFFMRLFSFYSRSGFQKLSLLFVLFWMPIMVSYGQIFGGDGNKTPKITGQKTLTTNEEQSITIEMTDLQVEDKDDVLYPIGFTMTLYAGSNYSLSANTVTPLKDFTGTLSVEVTVNDGEDSSEKFDLKIQVNNINDPPTIIGQKSLDSDEDKIFVFESGDLIIDDPDDTNFTITVGTGMNYTVSGQSITPSKEFSGILAIPVTVNDGEFTSPVYTIQLQINATNDQPKIISQQPLSTASNVPFLIQLSHLTVEDPDDSYPSDFSLKVLNGDNYSVSDANITAKSGFAGTLTVGVRVNDGSVDSETFNLKINVSQANLKPIITSQTPVIINEDESFSLTLSLLRVNDPESSFPNGFSLAVSTGDNYIVSGKSTITPLANYSGNLSITVTVSKGNVTSDPFSFFITVRPVNDAPKIELDTTALKVQTSTGSVQLVSSVAITDVDNDSLSLAEISFDPAKYLQGTDILTFKAIPGIKGVFDAQNGILALIGKASLADYSEALKFIDYELKGANNSARSHIVANIVVSDGQASSNTVGKMIQFSDGDIGPLDIPTGFTPNGDFVNDTWSLRPPEGGQSFQTASIRVYNKSGLLVFEAEGLNKEWDGKFNGTILPADVYFYTINFNLPDTKSIQKGIVTILR